MTIYENISFCYDKTLTIKTTGFRVKHHLMKFFLLTIIASYFDFVLSLIHLRFVGLCEFHL